MWPQNKKQEIFREQKQKTNAFRDAADDGSVSGEARPPQEGTKSDAGTTSGNHASVRVTGIMGIRYAYLWVGTYSSASNKGYTSTKYVDSTGLYELNYTTAVTNGTLYLHATTPNVGGGGMGGTWYP